MRSSTGYPRLSTMQTDTMPRVDTSWGRLLPVNGERTPLPFTTRDFFGWGLVLAPDVWALAWTTDHPGPKPSEIPPTVMGWGHGWAWALFRDAPKSNGGRVRQIQRHEHRLILEPGALICVPPTPGYFWAEIGDRPIWEQEIGHALKPMPAQVVHQTRPIVDIEVEAYLAEHPGATRLEVYHALGRRQTAIRASLNRLGYRVPGR